ncbi:hypothetical protein SLS62_001731 [Diatrype stigma]|uniref:MARVEL domain-containing protein n=1 Tax=Diatrype stigma TaxID=117547 RepID=A0AAN9YVP7_9PEZI
MLKIGAIAVRAILIASGAIVLGLSSGLAKHQRVESVPAVTSFSAFVGGFGLVVTALGLLSLWIEKFPTVLVLVADALSAVFYIAGGIALTLALKSVSSCSPDNEQATAERFYNKILNGGCEEIDGIQYCYVGGGDPNEDLTPGRCKRARSDNVFEYVGFVFAIGIIVITYLFEVEGIRRKTLLFLSPSDDKE